MKKLLLFLSIISSVLVLVGCSGTDKTELNNPVQIEHIKLDNAIPEFKSVALKSLTKSETLKYGKTNRHEFLGVKKLIGTFGELGGDRRKEFKAVYQYISDDNTLSETDNVVWYYFKSKRTDKKIYALYYTTNSITQTMNEGDLLIIGKTNNDEVRVIIVDKNSHKKDEYLTKFINNKPASIVPKKVEQKYSVEPPVLEINKIPTKDWIRIYFTPGADCESNIIEQIQNAKKIDIAVYSITNKKIVDALISAKNGGTKIRIITDRLQSKGKGSLVPELQSNGFEVKTNIKHKIMHHKFAVFDGKDIETGSYNWTDSATKSNAENCLFFKQTKKEFTKQYDYLWSFYDQ